VRRGPWPSCTFSFTRTSTASTCAALHRHEPRRHAGACVQSGARSFVVGCCSWWASLCSLYRALRRRRPHTTEGSGFRTNRSQHSTSRAHTSQLAVPHPTLSGWSGAAAPESARSVSSLTCSARSLDACSQRGTASPWMCAVSALAARQLGAPDGASAVWHPWSGYTARPPRSQ